MSIMVIAYILLSYLVGSINSAILLAKFYNLPDIRSVGSGNPGATNMVSLGGKKLGFLVFLFDMLKGMVMVYIAYQLKFLNYELGFVAVAVCLGHIYPIFFHFKGGKGVATAIGTVALIDWKITLAILCIWLGTFLITRISSLSSIAMAVFMPLVVWLVKPVFTFPVAMVSCLLIYRHHANIKRLLSGNEKVFKSKVKK